MSIINYTPEVYNLVVQTKTDNENYINEILASLNNLTFADRLAKEEIIKALQEINLEYEKYIIVYNAKYNKVDTRETYVCIEGDSLPRIAYKLTGKVSNWQAIYTHNNLNDIKLTPGQVIELPSSYE